MNEIIKNYRETISEGRKNCDNLIDRAKRSAIMINGLESQARTYLTEIRCHLDSNDNVSAYEEYVDKTIKDIMNFKPYDMARYTRMSNTMKSFRKDDGFVGFNELLSKLGVLLHRMLREASTLNRIFSVLKSIENASSSAENDTIDRTLKALETK